MCFLTIKRDITLINVLWGGGPIRIKEEAPNKGKCLRKGFLAVKRYNTIINIRWEGGPLGKRRKLQSRGSA